MTSPADRDARPTLLGRLDIAALLPHRFPFLFVDRIVALEPGRRATGIRLVSADDRYVSCQAGERPVLASTILLESVGQVGAVMILSHPTYRGRLFYFTGIRRARARRPVYAGDEVVIEVVADRIRRSMGMLRGSASVRGEVVATGVMTFALGPSGAPFDPDRRTSPARPG